MQAEALFGWGGVVSACRLKHCLAGVVWYQMQAEALFGWGGVVSDAG